MEPEGVFADVKPFAVHDGPGIRTTLFLKGCPLRCVWCHNPETIRREPELAFFASKCLSCGRCAGACSRHRFENRVHTIDRNGCTACGECVKRCPAGALRIYGERISVPEAFRLLTADRMFYETSGGGVTLSGGEPLLQPEFCEALLRQLRNDGIHTALDTCGDVPWRNFERLLPWTNLFLFDLKAVDPGVHRKCTGADNRTILENLRRLDACGIPFEIRMPLMPGWNDAEDDLRKAGELLSSLRSAPVPVRLLACHDFARSKYAAVGRPDTMPRPTAPELSAAAFLRRYPVRIVS
ncbi:glycyl-radical enzyme activating protein [uncultured Victivallis sp.]|uniref:glycyl-radical enzyme activating protein n=1 Tax=uncultured Victivallis sp. TaxID=354118 RepID=UPI0025989374|nr:glycyl-radical enzyme activating protein [uncultured Victivallis sp.]